MFIGIDCSKNAINRCRCCPVSDSSIQYTFLGQIITELMQPPRNNHPHQRVEVQLYTSGRSQLVTTTVLLNARADANVTLIFPSQDPTEGGDDFMMSPLDNFHMLSGPMEGPVDLPHLTVFLEHSEIDPLSIPNCLVPN